MTVKELILANIESCCDDLMFYGRKDDDELTQEIFDNALKTGIITKQEIIDEFTKVLTENWPT